MGQTGGFMQKPGASSLVHDAAGRGTSGMPGKRTLADQVPVGTAARSGAPTTPSGGTAGAALHLDGDKPKHANAPGPGTGGLGAWVGAGKTGQVFQNATTEDFVDGGTKDALEIRTGWTLAEFASYELGTDAVMEAERTIHVRLARGSSILARSRARAWFHADRLPNDVHAALHAPAKRVEHEGSIIVTDDKGLHVLETHPHPLGRALSMAAMLAGEPMLDFATPPEQRLREANRFAADTVPRYDANLLLIEGITRDAPRAALGLRDHIEAKLGYESPSPDALAVARHVIARIETVVSHSATGYEGTDLLMHLAATRQHLGKLLHAAERARPEDKDLWDHAADAVKAVGKAVVGLGTAVKEIALTARDPLDLRWLRTLTDLPDEMLEFMALDPSTHWKTFMKVSGKPSDYFPSNVKKLLEKKDYVEAAAKLRGVAGELIFVVDNIELPQ